MAFEHHIRPFRDGSSLLLISLRRARICPFEVHLHAFGEASRDPLHGRHGRQRGRAARTGPNLRGRSDEVPPLGFRGFLGLGIFRV